MPWKKKAIAGLALGATGGVGYAVGHKRGKRKGLRTGMHVGKSVGRIEGVILSKNRKIRKAVKGKITNKAKYKRSLREPR